MKQATLLLICSLPLASVAAEVRFSGKATPVGANDLLYEERHTLQGECSQGRFQPQSHTVSYARDNGTAFAEKQLSYGESPLRPSVDFRQPGFNEVMDIANRNDESLSIRWQTPGGKTENFTVRVNDSLVADAGFDNFVRKHWPAVTAGESVNFDFLAPTRGEAYGFVLEPAEDSRIDAAHTVRIRPSGMVLRFLVDPIVLGYNDDGFLTDYLGLTNIRQDKDTNYTAHIRYTVETTPDCELTG